jgi:phosphatidylglycerophosphatase C
VPGRSAAAAPGHVLALFDLDGTISVHDTLNRYLLEFIAHHPGCALRLPRALPALVRFLSGHSDQGALKSAWIRAVLGGRSRAELASWTAQFVPPLIARGLHADALSAIAAHRAAGDALVLLSASPDLYVPALGEALGFTATVCTAIAWQADRLDGALASPNRRGTEKARCLIELRRRYGLPVTAYANAASDLEHLALAEYPRLVNGTRATRAAAARLGIPCLRWR